MKRASLDHAASDLSVPVAPSLIAHAAFLSLVIVYSFLLIACPLSHPFEPFPFSPFFPLLIDPLRPKGRGA
jgi:hypothetical protein